MAIPDKDFAVPIPYQGTAKFLSFACVNETGESYFIKNRDKIRIKNTVRN